MYRNRLPAGCWMAAFVAIVVGVTSARAEIFYSIPDSLYQQDFLVLAASNSANKTWSNDSTVLGWYGFRDTTALTGYTASTGSGLIGELNAFGATTVGFPTERALGSRPSAGTINIAAGFRNSSPTSLASFTVTYNGEQWLKAANANAQSLAFSYGFGENFADISSWTSVHQLDFTSPVFNANAATSLIGNNLPNRVANIAATIDGLNWRLNEKLWLRWTDIDDPGEDHGLAIDDFRFSASTITAVPEPSSIVLLSLTFAIGLALRRIRKRVQTL